MKEYIAEQIRLVCIKNDWYTCGTCEEYNAMFELVYTGAAIVEIADNIYAHSETTKCGSAGAAYKAVSDIVAEARRIWATME